MLYCWDLRKLCVNQSINDLTQGSISKHLVTMSIPIGIGLLLQTLYFVVDLYFISTLGEHAIAGVGIAGNLNFLIIAITQIFNVGVTAIISHAVGRNDTSDAQTDFNQALLLCSVFSVLTLLLGYGFSEHYITSLTEDPLTAEQARIYLWWFLPNMAMQFAMTVMIASLRGIGIVKPGMIVQLVAVIINIILSPILISGWLTGHALGVMGAGLSSTIAAFAGLVILTQYFKKSASFFTINVIKLKPSLTVWRKIFMTGLPVGGEFVMMFTYMAIVFWALQDLGSHTQAGFSIGQRIMQSLLMPGLALSFAAPAIVGQNFGAGKGIRIQQTLSLLLTLNFFIMGGLAFFCINFGDHLMGFFTQDTDVIQTGSMYLFWSGFSFFASAVILSCNGIYQGLGHTWPALFSSVTRLLIVVTGIALLLTSNEFKSEWIWQLSLAANIVQAVLSHYLLKKLLKQKLTLVHTA